MLFRSGFMMIKYGWGIGKTHWFKAYPFVIVAINILIAVASDFESAINGWYKWAAFIRRCMALWWMAQCNEWYCRSD